MLQGKKRLNLLKVTSLFMVLVGVVYFVQIKMININGSSQVGVAVLGTKEGVPPGEIQTKCKASRKNALGFTKYNDFGDGSEFNPYQIWTAAQLYSMKDAWLSGSLYFLQCRDVDLITQGQFTINNFSGDIYDGNFFYIDNYNYQDISDNIQVSLFKNLGNGTIKNVRMRNVNISLGSSNTSASALVGDVSGGRIENIKIDNVYIKAQIATAMITRSFEGSYINKINITGASVNGATMAAGLVYYVAMPSTVQNVKVQGDISAEVYASAGVLGFVTNSSGGSVPGLQNLSFKGNLYGPYIGGIVYQLQGAQLKNVQVEASIYATADTLNNSAGVGGIVGTATDTSIEKANFKGFISRKVQEYNTCGLVNFVGGVAGYLERSKVTSSYSKARFEIEYNCGGTGGVVGLSRDSSVKNSFASTAMNFKGSNGYAGGLVGSIFDSSSSVPVFENNYSELFVGGDSTAQIGYLGGHLGFVSSFNVLGAFSFATGGAFPPIAISAGSYVGFYGYLGGGTPPLPFSPYYFDESMLCVGLYSFSCNNIGTPKTLAQLLDVTINPLKQWTFNANSWVMDTFPEIPTAKSNY